MAVGLGEETPYYLVPESVTEGAPRARLTVYNVPDGTRLDIRWASGSESGYVQGLRGWVVSNVGTEYDWAPPLNREITYTVIVGGAPVSAATLVVESATAWIQDPLHPDRAIPVHSRRIVKGALMFDSKAISSATYANNGTATQIGGSRYPRFSSGMRSAAQGISATMWSDDESTETAFRQMVMDSPVLLLRPLPEHRMLPPLCYIAADVNEDQRTVRLGQDLTHWTVAGNLVQAVLQAAQSGFVTYQDVQDLLGGYTYGEVRAAAASTTYLDWQKNPLIFTYL